MRADVALGRLYRCPVCGAEVVVIRAASGQLDPICCNVPMESGEPLVALYHCEACGSEVAVMRGGGGPLELVCCNEPMKRLEGTAPPA